jgi:hypothetical protein
VLGNANSYTWLKGSVGVFSALEPSMRNAFTDFYRCPEGLLVQASPDESNSRPGYFHFGPGAVCYGRSAFNSPAKLNGTALPDMARHVVSQGATLRLPFDASETINNLRFERYPTGGHNSISALSSNEPTRRIYYWLRPALPDPLRKSLQRLFLRDWDRLPFPQWPVDTSVERMLERILVLSMKAAKLESVPFIWFWPDGAPASAILTHDVETTVGLNFIPQLIDIDDAFGIKTSFQLVPEQRYRVSRELLELLRVRQCEVNVHGLNHDGNLFRDRESFLRQARWINRYVQYFGAAGFRAACMYRNVEWYDDLDISYDMSVPNVAHLEPQRGGCCTVFPYFIGKVVELPLTTIQDYSLFHILGDYSIELWKKQIDLISERHGMLSFIVHPDYVMEEKSLSVYKTLLAYLSQMARDKKIWIARPGEVDRWWRQRDAMKLVFEQGKWRVTGRGRERARIAFACLKNDDQMVYAITQGSETTAEPAMRTI